MSWWWELFDQRNMMPYFRGVRMISDEMIKTGNGSFAPFSLFSGTLEGFGVRCGKSYFVYLLNNSDTVVTTPVTFPIDSPGSAKLRSFDPDDLTFNRVETFVIKDQRFSTTVDLKSRKELVLIVE